MDKKFGRSPNNTYKEPRKTAYNMEFAAMDFKQIFNARREKLTPNYLTAVEDVVIILKVR